MPYVRWWTITGDSSSEDVMDCRLCNHPVNPEEIRCPGCGAQVVSKAPSLFERVSREVKADHAEWRRDLQAMAAVPMPTPSPAVVGRAAAPQTAVAPQALAKVAPVRSPTLEVEAVGMLNLLLLHAGFSPLRHLAVSGFSGGAELAISAQPAAVRRRTLPLGAETERLERPSLAPDLDFFARQDEAAHGSLEVVLTVAGQPPVARSLPVTVQPANEWVDQPGAEAALAGAVTPNAVEVAELASSFQENFRAYQGANQERRRAELEAVYRGVAGVGLKYVGNPPSFEGTGQKVLFPAQTLNRRQGCCLDIALLEASLLERLGYRPLIFLLHNRERGTGHALCGVWLADVRAQTSILRDIAVLEPLLAQGDLLVWNSTSYFEGAGDDFPAAVAAGKGWMEHFAYALDVAACREQGVKPVAGRRS